MSGTPTWLRRAAASDFLIIADHGSNFVPPGIELGIGAAELARHIAVDLGTAALAEALSARLGAPCLIAGTSRLVVDLNRPPQDPAAIPESSDGTAIPGNVRLGIAARASRTAIHAAYHDALDAFLDERPLRLLLSLHSFTPEMRAGGAPRPWDAGLLYDRDGRAARLAIDWLRGEGLSVGDNEPYSGTLFGYTMQRHAEPRGIPYLFVEIRQDRLANDEGIGRWAERLAALARHVADELTSEMEVC